MFYLKLFGSPSLDGEVGTGLTGRAVQRHRLALLALLARAPALRFRRDKLIAYLWPDSDAERGRNILNVSTYVLRKVLGEGALLSAGDDLRLNADVIQADVAEFEAALQRSDHARAVALYCGPFLDGFFLREAPEFEHWAERERERLAGGYGKALEALAEVAEAAQDAATAAEWWKARAAHDPYDSRVALRFMQSLVASGSRAGALRHAAIHQRLLQEEFGMGPAPEITVLAERLRSGLVSETPALDSIPKRDRTDGVGVVAAMNRLRYADLASNAKALRAHTGLNPAEFDELCVFFDEAWHGYIRHHTLEGKPRRRQGKPCKNSTLPTTADKLLFVLYYLKTNPLQEVLASAFAMRQPKASVWLGLLLSTLEQALERADCLPERHSERLARAVADHQRLLLYGTERPLARSTDYETQKVHYRGKKNATL